MSFTLRLARCFFPLALLSLHAQTLEVTPARILADEVATIRVTGCQPNERLAIRSELVDGANGHWVSQSMFIADAQGNIDASAAGARLPVRTNKSPAWGPSGR